MRPQLFVASQFFLLSLFFVVLYDPLGISYFLLGTVWLFSHKVAYFETVLIFLLKGQYWILFTGPAWMSIIPIGFLGGVWRARFAVILPYDILFGWLYGAILSVQLAGKIVKSQLARKAPDLSEAIGR